MDEKNWAVVMHLDQDFVYRFSAENVEDAEKRAEELREQFREILGRSPFEKFKGFHSSVKHIKYEIYER